MDLMPSKLELSQRERLLTLISTCEEMILLAQKGEWRRVSELENRRSREIADYFSRPMSASEAQQVRPTLARMSRLNGQLVEIATAARDQVAEQLKELSTAGKAADAYQINSGVLKKI